MRISIVAAMGQNRVIGTRGKLPWSLPDDLSYFKRLTLGHPVVMGRETYQSIGHPLKERMNIVLSRNPKLEIAGCLVAGSLEKALLLVQKDLEVFVIGGESVFCQALPLAQRLYITEVEASPDGDTFFPKFDASDFEVKEKVFHPSDLRHEYSFNFVTYQRKIESSG